MSRTLDSNLVEKYEDIVRKMITSENELINQRMASFNGLLFAALGFAWDKVDTKNLKVIFSILGFSASFLNGIALIFASIAHRRLLLWWRDNKPKIYKGPGVTGSEPLDKKLYSMFLTPWILLAFIFAVGWLAIFYSVLYPL